MEVSNFPPFFFRFGALHVGYCVVSLESIPCQVWARLDCVRLKTKSRATAGRFDQKTTCVSALHWRRCFRLPRVEDRSYRWLGPSPRLIPP